MPVIGATSTSVIGATAVPASDATTLNGIPSSGFLQTANNLSDVGSAASALTNIGGMAGGKIPMTGQTANFTVTLPANCMIAAIVINETSGHAIPSGIKIGTTSGAADVVASLVIGANALLTVPVASLLKNIFSTGATQTLFIQAVSSWNSASINFELIYYSL